jgi:nucleoside-diphosphate-sugar epimerase
MRVLVTGAKGFVGKAIISALSQSRIEFVILDLPPAPADIPPENFFGVDITKVEELEGLSNIGGIDAVIHAAGLAHQFGVVTREKFWRVNVDGTENATRLAARLNAKRFILISSVSVYGKVGEEGSERSETSACNPEGLYAESKYESENAARRVCEKHGIDLTILRLATVIGEGDAGNVSRLIKALDKRKFYWIGKGENRKSLVYKGDVARACLALLTGKQSGGAAYNISARPETMKNIVSYIEHALGKKVLPIGIPPGILKLAFGVNSKTLGIGRVTRLGETVEKWLSDETFSAARFKADYAFEPETTIEEAIKREVSWYLANK